MASASDACVVMDKAPSWYGAKTRDDLRLAEVGLEPEPNDYVRQMYDHGHRQEELCLQNANVGRSRPWRPLLVESDCGRFGASLDGAVVYAGRKTVVEWLEIKSPFHRGSLYAAHRALRDGYEGMPVHWYWQLVHQAMVLGEAALRVDLLVWDAEDQSVVSTMPDMKRLQEDAVHLRWAWECYFNDDDIRGP